MFRVDERPGNCGGDECDGCVAENRLEREVTAVFHSSPDRQREEHPRFEIERQMHPFQMFHVDQFCRFRD